MGAGVRRRPKTRNRIAAVMEHTSRYAFRGRVRLAKDAGVSHSAVSRLLNGKRKPSAELLFKVTKALEARSGRHLDPRDLITFDGVYPTQSVCRLMGCAGCLSDHFYDGDGNIQPKYLGVRSGEWSDYEVGKAAS